MTIKELSNCIGVNYRTIYRHAEKAGKPVNSLRGDDGNLTQEGVIFLTSLFDAVKCADIDSQDNNIDKTSNFDSVTTPNDIAIVKLEAENRELKARLEGKDREIELLQQALDAAKQSADQWRQQAERAQQLHTLEIQRQLPERAGLWQRMRELFAKGDKQTQ